MKIRLVISLIICTTFLACKKDRTCSCTVTTTGTTSTTGRVGLQLFPGFSTPLADTSFSSVLYDRQLIDKKIVKVNKRVAESNCVSYSEPFTETMPLSVPASSFNLSIIVTNKGIREYECDLK